MDSPGLHRCKSQILKPEKSSRQLGAFIHCSCHTGTTLWQPFLWGPWYSAIDLVLERCSWGSCLTWMYMQPRMMFRKTRITGIVRARLLIGLQLCIIINDCGDSGGGIWTFRMTFYRAKNPNSGFVCIFPSVVSVVGTDSETSVVLVSISRSFPLIPQG